MHNELVICTNDERFQSHGATNQGICKRCERAGVKNIPADQTRNGEPICSDCVADLNETDWDSDDES